MVADIHGWRGKVVAVDNAQEEAPTAVPIRLRPRGLPPGPGRV